ncbi:hypothetical protein C8J57DRAFT_1028894, partial [Mycena rebaudengoi]
LEAYPLRRPSAICKVAGGGRWVPEHTPETVPRMFPLVGKSRKRPYQVEIELAEQKEEKKYQSKIVQHGG